MAGCVPQSGGAGAQPPQKRNRTLTSLWEDHYGIEVGQNKGEMSSRKSKTKKRSPGPHPSPPQRVQAHDRLPAAPAGGRGKGGCRGAGLGCRSNGRPYEVERRATSISASRGTRQRWVPGRRARVWVGRPAERRATSISASRGTRRRWELGCLGRAEGFVLRDWGPAYNTVAHKREGLDRKAASVCSRRRPRPGWAPGCLGCFEGRFDGRCSRVVAAPPWCGVNNLA
jgi:hypothetical protein